MSLVNKLKDVERGDPIVLTPKPEYESRLGKAINGYVLGHVNGVIYISDVRPLRELKVKPGHTSKPGERIQLFSLDMFESYRVEKKRGNRTEVIDGGK